MGKRFIVLHAGSDNGQIPSAVFVFQPRHNTRDYRDEMEHQTIRECFNSYVRVFPTIPSNSFIIIVIALYHSHQKEPLPTQNWTKAMWMEWLSCNGSSYPDHAKAQEWTCKKYRNQVEMKTHKKSTLLWNNSG